MRFSSCAVTDMTSTYNPTELQTDIPENHFWYALRTFNCQEQKVSLFLTAKDCIHFIPMAITQSKAKEGEAPKRILVPAIHNILFVQKKGTSQQMTDLLKDCPVPVSIFRHPGENKPCEIPAKDMMEIQMLCDPQFQTENIFMTQDEAENLIGKEVRVIQGPMKGSIGRLVRKNKHFFFLKIVTGMGVMVRISRWYCKPLQTKSI